MPSIEAALPTSSTACCMAPRIALAAGGRTGLPSGHQRPGKGPSTTPHFGPKRQIPPLPSPSQQRGGLATPAAGVVRSPEAAETSPYNGDVHVDVRPQRSSSQERPRKAVPPKRQRPQTTLFGGAQMGGCRSDANTQSLSGRVPDIWLRSNQETSRVEPRTPDRTQNARPHPERQTAPAHAPGTQTAPRTPDPPGTDGRRPAETPGHRARPGAAGALPGANPRPSRPMPPAAPITRHRPEHPANAREMPRQRCQ